MAIYAAIKNLGEGSIGGESDSYTYDYLVITDHTDTPETIYTDVTSQRYIKTMQEHIQQMKQQKYPKDYYTLPVYGEASSITKTSVSSISITRFDDANQSSVPSFKLPKKDIGSYAFWTYSVTYTANDTSIRWSISKSKKPWETGTALSFNTSTKSYTVDSFYAYGVNGSPVAYTGSTRQYAVRNAVGDLVRYYENKNNLVISFTYALKDIDSDTICETLSTVNSRDMLICGVPIPAFKGKITALSYSSQTTDDGDFYKIVSCSIEIAVEKDVIGDILYGNGYYAYPEGSKIAVQIQQLNGTLSSKNIVSESNIIWFDKDAGIGNFSNESKLVAGVDYAIVSEPKLLTPSGNYLKQSLDEAVLLDDSAVNKIYVQNSLVNSWGKMGFPKKQ